MSRRAGCAFPVELLVFACVVVGIFPAVTIGPFLDVAVARCSVPVRRSTPHAVAWLQLPLLMSFFALAGGAVLYWCCRSI